MRDICLDRQHSVANRFHGFVQSFFTATRDDYFRSFFLKTLCRCQTDTTVSTGYYCYFSFQSAHRFPPQDLSAHNLKRTVRSAVTHLVPEKISSFQISGGKLMGWLFHSIPATIVEVIEFAWRDHMRSTGS